MDIDTGEDYVLPQNHPQTDEPAVVILVDDDEEDERQFIQDEKREQGELVLDSLCVWVDKLS